MKNPNPRIQLVCYFAATCLAFMPAAFAVNPPPDGGYANQNTAEGEDALFSLTTGTNNTALGYQALYSDTTGKENTAIGADALTANTIGGGNTASGFQALYSNTTGYDNTASGGLGSLLQYDWD